MNLELDEEKILLSLPHNIQKIEWQNYTEILFKLLEEPSFSHFTFLSIVHNFPNISSPLLPVCFFIVISL